MKFEFIQITQVGMHYFKSLSQEKSTQNEKLCFIIENELQLTEIELLSFFIFKSVHF